MMDAKDTVNDIAEAGAEASPAPPAAQAAEGAMPPSSAGDNSKRVARADDAVPWSERWAEANRMLNGAFTGLEQARGSISSHNRAVTDAEAALTEAEATRAEARLLTAGALDSAIGACETMLTLLAEHRETLISARAQYAEIG